MKDAEPAIEKFNMHTMDDLLAAIGSGDVRLAQVVNFIQGLFKEEDEPLIDPRLKPRSPSSHSGKSGQVIIQGVGSLMSHMAKCCRPVAGDYISGYITQGKGIAIHREDCEQFKRLKEEMPERVIDVEWAESYCGGYSVGIRVIGPIDDGLIKEVTSTLANAKIGVLNMKHQNDNKRQLMLIDLDIEIFSMDDLNGLLTKLDQLDGVIEAKRVSN